MLHPSKSIATLFGVNFNCKVQRLVVSERSKQREIDGTALPERLLGTLLLLEPKNQKIPLSF